MQHWAETGSSDILIDFELCVSPLRLKLNIAVDQSSLSFIPVQICNNNSY